MFIVTAKAPKARHVLLGATLILAALVGFLALRGKMEPSNSTAPLLAATNEQRVTYLNGLGWEVDAEPLESLKLTLPDKMEEPYLSYNALQLRQGFDLTPYLGETLERYTYRVTNYPDHPKGCQADVYVYDGAVVAGDVICAGANGFIDTLDFPTGE